MSRWKECCGRPGRFLAAYLIMAIATATGFPQMSEVAAQEPSLEEIAADPLFQKDVITLEDLTAGLNDPQRQNTVIERHFVRATGLSDDQQQTFLTDALRHKSPVVRRQAVDQLERLNILSDAVLQLVQDAGPMAEMSFKLAQAEIPDQTDTPAQVTEIGYIRRLILQLVSEEITERFAAETQLEAIGSPAVSELVLLLTDTAYARPAARMLGRILRAAEEIPETYQLEAIVGAAAESLPAKAPMEVSAETTVREPEKGSPTKVRVFFGTNRELLREPESAEPRLFNGSVIVVGAILMLAFRLGYRRGSSEASHAPGVARRILLPFLLIMAAAWGLREVNFGWQQYYAANQGAQFGIRRSPDSRVRYGHCDISIPPTHEVGEVERPLLGAEDERVHVVLTQTEVQEDRAFFDDVRALLADVQTDGECFVFVHGYNVDFDSAARRTAQIHYDLKFRGVPLFFSWPSRASFRHYFSDRNEILVSRQAIREFLQDVAQRAGAKKVHVIAHSMGADAVCQAIAELDGEGRVFEQVILAAPDIDADVFEHQLLPKMKPRARRTTLYCSSNDWALYASYHFNDSRRAGDSRDEHLITSDGLDTVDASHMDTELLGHSYYGSCLPLIRDVGKILASNLSPPERDLEPRQIDRPVPYWTFPPSQMLPPELPLEAAPVTDAP
ncbi:MAG: alpha/beta fold hydrolase [Planctomycetaceae bacterium]|nr:alpha/beta fold hydrolase [Planctomycetaceae bacterium]